MQEKSTSKQILRQLRFELIEVLIVVAIIGLLTSIAIPLYSQYIGPTSNSTAQSGLKTEKTSWEGYSVRAGNSRFQAWSPTGIDPFAPDSESFDDVALGYTGYGCQY